MTQTSSRENQMLRNLATALRDRQNESPETAKLPTATDEDILRAMLGKPWRVREVESTEARKAG